ncbi:MAG: DUF4180 domain-containing protein [Bacteroidales bacterium]|nr:DUF4180 domain-containing protein [Bacteroidales bacterium]
MEIIYTGSPDQLIAELQSDQIEINTVQDALDLMANCRYNGSEKIIVNSKNLHPTFFDLKSGMAGEILQKFSNYRCQLAIIGDFENIESKSLRDFIRESNRMGRIFFVGDREEGVERLK